jgi:hypothetical protein
MEKENRDGRSTPSWPVGEHALVEHRPSFLAASYQSNFVLSPVTGDLSTVTRTSFMSAVLSLREAALRGDEAIQLDRRGALRAPRDDSPFEDTP